MIMIQVSRTYQIVIQSVSVVLGEDELVDGEITFMIRDDSAGNNLDSVTSQNTGSSLQKKEAVYNAVEEWDLRIEGLNFREVQNRYDADIEIRF